ncbi:MAG: hypothetical protein K2P78_14170, partial [Gemmataceae bacterium]|nr:hypothetical protein [Gemmataceae bacterium]
MHSRTAVVLLLIALASPLTLGCGSSSMGPPATNRDGDIPAERKRDDYGPGESWVTLDELEGSWCG